MLITKKPLSNDKSFFPHTYIKILMPKLKRNTNKTKKTGEFFLLSKDTSKILENLSTTNFINQWIDNIEYRINKLEEKLQKPQQATSRTDE